MATETIGPYRVVRELGHGGMAAVYLAADSNNALVALKLMNRDLSAVPGFRRRFQREAEVLKRLRHPAIVPIRDHGEHEGRPYLVMPYLTGGTLTDRLSDGPLPPSEVALVERIAGALDSAHTQGIIHRDVKPSNILFDKDGRPYLADFGIVKVQNEITAATQSGTSLGTPGYMSPEQVRAQPLDGRSDIYALGVILFEMLTGRLPFVDTNPYAQAFMHVSAPIPVARDLNPDLSPTWQPIIDRALAKEPAERYPTASAMVRDVFDIINPFGTGWLSGPAPEMAQPLPPPRYQPPLPPLPPLPQTEPASTVVLPTSEDTPTRNDVPPMTPLPPEDPRPGCRPGRPVVILVALLLLIAGAWIVLRFCQPPPPPPPPPPTATRQPTATVESTAAPASTATATVQITATSTRMILATTTATRTTTTPTVTTPTATTPTIEPSTTPSRTPPPPAATPTLPPTAEPPTAVPPVTQPPPEDTDTPVPPTVETATPDIPPTVETATPDIPATPTSEAR